MQRTASWHGLADPFDPMESLRHSAAYLRELVDQFGNLGLRGGSLQCRPRPSQRLANQSPRSPGRNAQLRGSCDRWTADEWASSSSPEKVDTTIPQGVPCTRLANLILAPKQERQRIAAYIPRWGIQLAAHLSESTAWAIYRDAIGKPSAWPVVLIFALAGLLGGLCLQLRTITINQDTLVSKGLFRDPIVIDRRDVSAVELRFSAFQLENISSRRNEIVISRAGHQPVTMSLKSFSKSDAQTILTFFDNKIVNSHGQF